MQRDMIGFARRYSQFYRESADHPVAKRFSIAMDRDTRRVAESLESRGLIGINRDCGNWIIWLIEDGERA